MSRLFGNNKPKFERKRVVREAGALSSPENYQPPVEVSPVDKVYSDLSDTIDAANAALPYLADAAMTFHIDVPANLPELRAAIARKDDRTPDGGKITFNLFTKTLSHFEELRNEFTKDVFSSLTGNDVKDAVAINNKKSMAISGNIGESDMDLINSAWFMRFTAWTLMKQFAVNTILHQTAPKLPSGSESPGYAADFIQSVTFGYAMDAANSAYAKLASQGNEAVKNFIETNPGGSLGAKDAEFGELEQKAIDKMAEGDFARIMDYCMKELSGTSDAGLFSWLSYANARGLRNDAVGAFRHSPQYVSNAPDGSGKLVPMSQSYLAALSKKTDALYGALNVTVQVAGLRFEADALCCLTKVFGNISTKKLKSIRQLLRLGQNLRRNEMSAQIQAIAGGYTNFLDKATQHSLISLLERTYNDVVEDAIDSVDIPDDDYRIISDVCPIVIDYSEIIFDSVEYLLGFIQDLTVDVADDPVAAPPEKNPYALSNGHIIHKKWIDTALRLLDSIINVIDNGNCDLDEDGQMPIERTQELVADIHSSTNNGTAQIPAEVIEEFFPNMESISVPAPGGQYSFAVPKNGTTASSVDERTAMQEVFERCGKKLTNEQLDRILKDTNGAI